MLLKNATILTDKWQFEKGDLRVQDGKIAEIGELTPLADEVVYEAKGNYLIPGLVETHFHGAMGQTADYATEEMLTVFSNFEASRGITTFVPGLATNTDDVVDRFLLTCAAFMKKPQPGSKLGGAYLEGPFISNAKRGAHRPELLQKPSAEKLRRWQELSGGIIRKTVIAPELEDAPEAIRAGVDCGMVVEIGHTAATYEQAMVAIDNGATLSTHTFNAMNALNHREPGVLGAVLTDARVTCELIADFGHVAPAVVKLVYLAKGDDRVNIISDSMLAAGLSDGEYQDWDGRITIVKNGLSRTVEGTITGSACTIMEGLRNLVSIGVPLESGVKMCAYNPARTIGLADEIGSITVGKCADLVVLDKDLSVEAVWVDGRQVK